MWSPEGRTSDRFSPSSVNKDGFRPWSADRQCCRHTPARTVFRNRSCSRNCLSRSCSGCGGGTGAGEALVGRWQFRSLQRDRVASDLSFWTAAGISPVLVLRPLITTIAFMRTQLISCRLPKADSAAITGVALALPVPFRLFFVRWISVGEGFPLGGRLFHLEPRQCRCHFH